MQSLTAGIFKNTFCLQETYLKFKNKERLKGWGKDKLPTLN
jgi:hypothetical protein